MKRLFASALALTLTFSAVPLPANVYNSSVVVASAVEYQEAKTFSSDTTINDDVQIYNGMTVTNGATVVINGDLKVEWGKLDIKNGTVIVMKNFFQNSLYNGGTTDVSGGTLDVKGDLWVGDKEFNVGAGKVNVGKDLYLAGYNNGNAPQPGYGNFIMNNANGTVNVHGNMLIKLPSTDRNGRQLVLTNGTLSVAGDLTLTVKSNKDLSSYFNNITTISQNHKTVLNGSGKQNVALKGLKLGTVVLQQNTANYTGDDITRVGQKMVYNGGGGPSSSSQKPASSSGKAAESSSKAASSSSKAAESSSKAASSSSKAPSTSSATSKTNISGASVTFGGTYAYTGTYITPDPKVVVNGRTLTKGTDYMVSYSGHIYPGTANATITGIGNYAGTANGNFTITKRDLSNVAMTLSQTSYNYTGNSCTPAVTVMIDGKELGSGGHYKVTYTNNVQPGTATCTITAIGNYCTGSQSKNFTITGSANSSQKPASSSSKAPDTSSKASSSSKAPSSSSKAPSSSSKAPSSSSRADTSSAAEKINIFGATVSFTGSPYKYTGKALTPTPVVKLNGKTLTKDVDYKVSYSNNTYEGTASCTVEGIGAYTGTAAGSFSIRRDNGSSSSSGKTDISSGEITLAKTEYTYTGKEIKPEFKIVMNGTALKEGTDYKVTYLSNVDAGSGLIYIEGIGSFTGSTTRSFTIKPSSDSSKSDDNVIKGDVNKDGEVNVTDISMVASHIKGIKALSEYGQKAGDVDNNKDINVTDIAMIASHIKGIKPL